MYPRLSETFILTEILAHEAAGLDLHLFSLRAPVDGRFHADLARVRAGLTYVGGETLKAEEIWSGLSRAWRGLPGGAALAEFSGEATGQEVYQAILVAEAALRQGIVHLHAHFATTATTVARIAARLAGITYSFTAHAKDIFHESVVEEDLRRKLRDAGTVVTVSEYNAAHLRRTFDGDAARVQRIYNGLDLAQFPFEAPAQRQPLLVGVGRLVEKKGFEDLIDACAVLARRGRPFRCEIIGDGALMPRLDAQVRRLHLSDHVSLLGARARDEVIARTRAAAVALSPCVVAADGNRDGLPTVLLEAMALGTPCVSTDVTGIPEVVRHGESGLIVPQHDPQALAVAAERLLDDAALRVRLASRARCLIETDFDIHRNTAVMRAAFAPAADLSPMAVGA
jgi:glycosyltransferase involved in cell wall biosynthesis